MKILSICSGHDASACFLNNGKVEAYLKEERFSRIKRDQKIDNIFKFCLDYYAKQTDVCNLSTNFDSVIQNQKYRQIIQKNSNIKLLKHKYNHHLYHATLSFYNSGFDRSLVVVVDSGGRTINDGFYECESIYVGEYPDKFTPVYKNYFSKDYLKKSFNREINGCEYTCNSPFGVGGMYISAALLMGQSQDDCGKAMGLSSYGSFIPNCPNFFNEIHLNISSVDWMLKYKNDDLPVTKNNYKFYADYCYEVQHQTQEVLCKLIQKGIEKTGIEKVCISGGYGMNIIANHLILERFPDVEFFFEPLCDDGGISIGSAMYFYRKLTKDSKIYPLETTSTHGFLYDVTQYKNQTAEISDIAKLLYENKSVAIYNGYAESGQRALGNRSILFNALNPDAKDIVNRIKKREWYRPFAAIVLVEDSHLYFDMGRVTSNEYMTVCFPVKTELIPGVTHVDNTCRVQTVCSGHLYEILKEFKKLSGHGVLLNTSFNLAGEPLVETPDDAFKTLNNSLLNYLWFAETKQLFN